MLEIEHGEDRSLIERFKKGVHEWSGIVVSYWDVAFLVTKKIRPQEEKRMVK